MCQEIPMRVIVEGNIGAGKSTVMSALKKAFPHAIIRPEPVDSWREELALFYEDPAKWALPFSLRVLLSHHQNKAPPAIADALMVVERSPLSCRHVFTQLLFNDRTMPEHHWDLFRQYYDVIGWEPEESDLILYIDTPVDVCLQRITQRHREGEKEGIDVQYLRRIEFQYANVLKFSAAPVIRLKGDSSQAEVTAAAIKAIKNKLQTPASTQKPMHSGAGFPPPPRG